MEIWEDFRAPCNVIYHDKASSEWRTQQLFLTDTCYKGCEDKNINTGYDFGTPWAFVADYVSVYRSFESGKKHTLSLPFSLTNAELKSVFGADYTLYRIGVQPSPAIGEYIKDIHFVKTTETTKAGHPYLLVPGEGVKGMPMYAQMGENDKMYRYGFKQKKVEVSSEDEVKVGVARGGYEYDRISRVEAGKVNFFFFGSSDGQPTDDKLVQVHPSKEGNVRPFRVYYSIPKSWVNLNTCRPTLRVKYVDEDEVSTGIDEVKDEAYGTVYRLDGRLVGTHVDKRRLPRGIYMIDGKKCIID